MKRICIVTTKWSSINNWIKPFLNEYNNRNIDVTIVCDMDSAYESELKKEFPFINTFPRAFPRGINFFGSIKSIFMLRKLFRREKFDMVQYSTPNASMYASIAAKFSKIPVRLYCQWGMVFVTMTGIKRFIFKNIEKTVCRFSTEIQPDSTGNLEFCRSIGFYDKTKSRVIWNGSAKGLDLSKFDISKKSEYSKEIREKYGISDNTPVVGFVGRLGREKGCNELFSAFKSVKEKFPTAKLLFIGPIEKEDTIEPDLLEYFKKCDDIIKTDRISDVEKYTAAMDVFVLPTYREGFGMSVIEASAMEVPVIVTKYPGPSSAISEGVSGYSVNIKDVNALVENIIKILSDKDLCRKLGEGGRKFVIEHFDQKVFKEKYMENRVSLLEKSNL